MVVMGARKSVIREDVKPTIKELKLKVMSKERNEIRSDDNDIKKIQTMGQREERNSARRRRYEKRNPSSVECDKSNMIIRPELPFTGLPLLSKNMRTKSS
ncbi:hypothetical protein ACET3Z_028293 [Daucus carota]